MTNLQTKPTVEILGATRPPENLKLKVTIPSENLPGVGVVAEVVIAGLEWEKYPKGEAYWSIPRISVAKCSVYWVGGSNEIQVTSGLWREISSEVENWICELSFDAIMSTAPHKETVAA
jgi:hypothetical protein